MGTFDGKVRWDTSVEKFGGWEKFREREMAVGGKVRWAGKFGGKRPMSLMVCNPMSLVFFMIPSRFAKGSSF